MDIGASIFFTEYSISPAELAVGARGARLRLALGGRALAHLPVVRRFECADRRRAGAAVLRRDGSFRHAERRGGRDRAAQARDRRRPRDPARHDPDGEARRLARPGLGRTLYLRHRRRVECRGDGKPWHGLRDPLSENARADRGDEGDLDPWTRRNTMASWSTFHR